MRLLNMDSLYETKNENVSADHSREESSRNSKTEFSEEEEALIATMYRLIGDRWALIAGRVPGRTAEEIEKYCASKYSSSSE